MSKPIVRTTADNGPLHYWCPGCDQFHGVWVHAPNGATGAQWKWNGSFDKPTFEPSVLVFEEKDGKQITVCHSVITNGVINFCGDCKHTLAGQSVPMTPCPWLGY